MNRQEQRRLSRTARVFMGLIAAALLGGCTTSTEGTPVASSNTAEDKPGGAFKPQFDALFLRGAGVLACMMADTKSGVIESEQNWVQNRRATYGPDSLPYTADDGDVTQGVHLVAQRFGRRMLLRASWNADPNTWSVYAWGSVRPDSDFAKVPKVTSETLPVGDIDLGLPTAIAVSSAKREGQKMKYNPANGLYQGNHVKDNIVHPLDEAALADFTRRLDDGLAAAQQTSGITGCN